MTDEAQGLYQKSNMPEGQGAPAPPKPVPNEGGDVSSIPGDTNRVTYPSMAGSELVTLPLQHRGTGPFFTEQVQIKNLPEHVGMKIQEAISRNGNPHEVLGWYLGLAKGSEILDASATKKLERLSRGLAEAKDAQKYFNAEIKPFLASMRPKKR